MGICHFVVGGTLGAHYVYAPEGVNGEKNVVMRVTGAPAHTVIAFSYLLIIIYALTLAPICWVYAAEVWSLETRATGMGIAAIGNWLFNFGASWILREGGNLSNLCSNWTFHPSGILEHSMEAFHCLRRHVHGCRFSVLSYLSRGT